MKLIKYVLIIVVFFLITYLLLFILKNNFNLLKDASILTGSLGCTAGYAIVLMINYIVKLKKGK